MNGKAAYGVVFVTILVASSVICMTNEHIKTELLPSPRWQIMSTVLVLYAIFRALRVRNMIKSRNNG